MLESMWMLVLRGTAGQAASFLEALCAMLFYIDVFPERLHHPQESH